MQNTSFYVCDADQPGKIDVTSALNKRIYHSGIAINRGTVLFCRLQVKSKPCTILCKSTLIISNIALIAHRNITKNLSV